MESEMLQDGDVGRASGGFDKLTFDIVSGDLGRKRPMEVDSPPDSEASDMFESTCDRGHVVIGHDDAGARVEYRAKELEVFKHGHGKTRLENGREENDVVVGASLVCCRILGLI